MPATTNAIAVNTGPLVALTACDGVDLLHRLHSRVVITPAVLNEFTRGLRQHPHQALPAWLEIRALVRPVPPILHPHLDEGEASAIALALECDFGLIVIDERRGRLVAREMGLSVTGSLGILLRAKRLGCIDTVAPRLEAMRHAGFWVADGLIARVLREAGE